jgi:hypothetical protein
VIVPVHGDVDEFTTLGPEDILNLSSEEDFERFWLSYATARLDDYARTGEPLCRGGDLHDLRRRVLSSSSMTDVSEAFQKAARAAHERAQQRPVMLLTDATEQLFGDRPLDQGASFRGLGRAWLRWRTQVPFVRFKCFVREYALLESTGQLVDRSHLQGKTVKLEWEERDAWWFLLRRLLGPVQGRTDLPRAVSELRSELTSETPPNDIAELRAALESVFPPKVYPGENEAPFHRWLWARVRDGKESVYPRVLLGFAIECQKIEKSSSAAGRRSVFQATTVRDAFRNASKEHAANVLAELDYLRPFLNALRDTGESWKVRYDTAALERAFAQAAGAASSGSTPSNELTPAIVLRILSSLGILRHTPQSWFRGESYDYEIPAIYKFELKPKPKGRV